MDAAARLGVTVGHFSVVLSDSQATRRDPSTANRVLVQYPWPMDDTIPRIREDLQRLYAWHMLWRIADAYGEDSPLVKRSKVRLQVAQLAGPNDTSRGDELQASMLAHGDCLAVRVINTSAFAHWYTAFFLNSRYGIEYVRSGSLPGCTGGQSSTEREIERISIDGGVGGIEGYVVIALSQREHPLMPDYRFLAQHDIGVAEPRRATEQVRSASPFERLLLSATRSGASFRSSVNPDNPQLAAWSWRTTPASDPNVPASP
jgi:hypothetical protein